MKYMFVICLLLLAWSADGQDYVITSRNDTLPGTLTIFSDEKVDEVQVKTSKTKATLKAVEVKVIVLNNETYHTYLTPTGYHFLKLVQSGTLSLYMGRLPRTASFDIQHLVIRPSKVLEVPNIRFQKQVADFLRDCLTIRQKLEEGNLGRKNLDQIIRVYNQCLEDQTKEAYVASIDPRLVAINAMRDRLKTDNTLASRNDTIEILNDLYEKVIGHQPVPNYLGEVLSMKLKDAPAYQEDCAKLLEMLKKP